MMDACILCGVIVYRQVTSVNSLNRYIMNLHRTYFLTAGTIFSVVAVIGFFSAWKEWAIIIGKARLPVWSLWAITLLAIFLAFRSFQFAKEGDNE